MFSLKTLILVLAIAVLLVVPAEATTSYFAGDASQEGLFNTAVGGLTLLNPALTFSSGDLGPSGLFNASGTGIDFLGFDDFIFNTPTDLSVVSGALTATQPGEVVKIMFPAASIYAFGFHISVVSGTGLWCVELTHGVCDYPVTNASNSAANVRFFGVVSTTPVTAPLYIRNSGGNPTMVLPNFQAYSASTVSATPEPHTMVLAGLGLVILGMARRKIRRRAW